MGEHSPFGACGWSGLALIFAIDIPLILFFLVWQGAIPLFWEDETFSNETWVIAPPPTAPAPAPPPPYGSAEMTPPQWLYFAIECLCNFTVTLICISLCDIRDPNTQPSARNLRTSRGPRGLHPPPSVLESAEASDATTVG